MKQRERVRDLVVVVPGIMGSVLARDGSDVWNLSRGAAWSAVKSRLGSLTRLRLPTDIGDDHPGDGVEPVDVMRTLHVVPGIWSPVVGYHGLLKWLRTEFTLDPLHDDHPGNLMAFPYDWRLSNRHSARELAATVVPALDRWRKASGHSDARIVFVCHSMGGLVARFFLEKEGGADLCRTLITLGTPYRGSLSALSHLVNGLRPGLGPVAIDLTLLARSLPSLHQLAPAYACLNISGGLVYPQETELSGSDAKLLADAALFHRQIKDGAAGRGGTPDGGPGYRVLPIRGLRQPTPTTAHLGGDGRLVESPTIEGWDEGGDGRVPRLSAYPPELLDDDPAIRGPVEAHGALPDHRGVRQELWQFFTARRDVHRAPDTADRLGVSAPDIVLPGEPIEIEVTAGAGEPGTTPADRLAVRATLLAQDSGVTPATRELANLGAGRYRTVFAGLPPGLYGIAVKAATGTDPVTCHVVVWDSNE